ncbi:MAG: hypothetical protein E3J90_08695 [Promethearchaeota archaeon]|nr:MAG: hypothetical protein E3J90_08695 [Candidatus Lokiarchaeota archaeon]
MNRKRLAFIIIIVIIVATGGIISTYLLYQIGFFFNPGNRYDWQNLDYMETPFINKSYINAWNEGYSESDNCPWGFTHNGLDFFFNHSAPVLAMAPGQVWSIDFVDTGAAENKYHIRISIRFSREIELRYGFEPWTNNENDARKQLEQLQIKVGDWVNNGDKIADFVAYNESAHIHFDIDLNGNQVCPKDYFSDDAYNKTMDLIHFYNSSWGMCYS